MVIGNTETSSQMLKKCTECGGQVSSDADACPHCGYRMRGRENLITCGYCGESVIPVANPHDTISRYCPLRSKAITNMGCRHVFLALWIVVAIFALALMSGLVAWFIND